MEESPHINIDELYETKQRIDQSRVQLYNKLLVRIHNKIKMTAKQRIKISFVICDVEILIGYPNYDFNECLLYVMAILEKMDF